MTFRNLCRPFAVLLAAHCVFSTGEVGSPTEGLVRGPLAAATLAPTQAHELDFDAHELTFSQPEQAAEHSTYSRPYDRGTVEASYEVARD